MTRAPYRAQRGLAPSADYLDTALSSAGKVYSTTCPGAWLHLIVVALSSADVAIVDGDLKVSAVVGLLSEDVKG